MSERDFPIVKLGLLAFDIVQSDYTIIMTTIIQQPSNGMGKRLVLNGYLSFDGRRVGGITTDLEGTLTGKALEDLHHSAHELVALRVGVHIDRSDYRGLVEKFPHFVGGPDIEIMREMWRVSNRRLAPEDMLRLDTKIYREQLYASTTVIEARPGAHEFFRTLKEANIPLAIGSITDPRDAWHIIDKANLRQYFDHVVLGGDVTHPKPHPQVYLETAQRMGVRQEEHLIMEDSRTGVRAAFAAHEDPQHPMIIALPVDPSEEVCRDLSSLGAHHVVPGWEELLHVEHTTPEGGYLRPPEGDGTLGFSGGMAAQRLL